jgi:hypothetical protein
MFYAWHSLIARASLSEWLGKFRVKYRPRFSITISLKRREINFNKISS